ncbi:MAG TPA: DUF2071 domain-containing protein [Gemmatimonadales bacterium]|nr:DUF2071 domain-containing protein [Gemmatimonadales bacterium]
MTRPFLTARWEELLFLSYRCPAEVLEPLVPDGTILDPWQGQTYLSLVGFHFGDTRVMGFPIPGHRHFEEVNLRFYVRREVAGQVRRAVVFIRELVPRRAIALVARQVYNEPYLAVPMSRRSLVDTGRGGELEYLWRYRGQPFGMRATVDGRLEEPTAGSLAEFITEHYWGYTRQRDGSTLEYRVEHPRWPLWGVASHSIAGDFRSLFGPVLGEVFLGAPDSVLAAAGSGVTVSAGEKLGT